MSKLSEDDSSDSSDEFLVPADKLDLDSSFFKQPVKKPNQKTTTAKKARVIESDSEDSEDDFDYSNESNVSSAELLSQVLKNLENANNKFSRSNKSNSEPSTSQDTNQSFTNDTNKNLSQEIDDLLSRGESQVATSTEDKESDNEEETKEDVKKEYVVPEKGVEIHFPGQNFISDKKKKKQQDLQRMLQNKINQKIRSSQLYAHKVGLLCWISHGVFLNTLANNADVLAFATSLVPKSNYPKDKADLKYLAGFVKWFAGLFKIEDEFREVSYNKKLLLQRISDKKIFNYVELVLLFVATIRGMGINCRLVVSLQPPPLKPSSQQLFKAPKVNDKNIDVKNETIKKEPVKNEKNKKSSNKTSSNSPSKTTQSNRGRGRGRGRKANISPAKTAPGNSKEADIAANEEAKKKAALFLQKFRATPSKGNKSILETHSPEKSSKFFNKKQQNDKSSDEDSSDDESYHDKLEKKKAEKNSRKKEKEKQVKTEDDSSKTKKQTSQSEKILLGKRKHSTSDKDSLEKDMKKETIEFSSDDEYVEKKPKKRVEQKPDKKLSIAAKLKNQRKLLSSDDDEATVIKKFHNVWAEVYVESEERWICVDVLGKKINCVSPIYQKAGQPVLYVIAWNSAGELKDVTRRYCPHWLTDTRKKRVDEKWWSSTLSNWKEKNSRISKGEDEELLRRELEQPLPKTVSECKGHPLYAIARHLLKFEAFYPPNCVPLGHLKTGEAIYSRHCVHTLMSRETWARKARVVKPAQEPYKIVKSMPKFDKLSGMKIKDQPLELFGKWQTDPYVPPEAKDGKVPRNDYGNVDLYKMSMLPKGTVWINLPALNRVARKLNIDCAPACVGFNFGCRGALPAFEGFVVCQEYEDKLRDAWEREQVDAEKRNKEKREKRIYGNWKKLIKGLMIRERLAAKYKFKDNKEDEDQIDDMEIDELKKHDHKRKEKDEEKEEEKEGEKEKEEEEEKEDLTTVQKKAMEKKTIGRVTRASKRKKEEPDAAKKRIKR